MDFSRSKAESFAKHMAPVLKTFVEKKLQPLHEKIYELEQRLAATEVTGLKYAGTYQRALLPDYRRGSVVTHHGSGWVCLTDKPSGAPGNGGDWQLFVKSARG